MRCFLFLYPVIPYVEYREDTEAPEPGSVVPTVEHMRRIINVRYREQGFRIAWLVFRVDGTHREPNRSLLDHRLGIESGDSLIVADISYEEMRASFRYAHPSAIFASLGPVTDLVLGGFHRTDCVDRIARAAHTRGIPTLVDEETTDWFFVLTRMNNQLPPVRRKPWEFYATIRSALKINEWTRDSLALHRQERSHRPWLVQI